MKHLSIVTKWSGFFWYQTNCEHSHTANSTVMLVTKIDISIAICVMLIIFCGFISSIIDIINNNDANNAIFFRHLFIAFTALGIPVCVINFLLCTKAAISTVYVIIDIFMNTTRYGINEFYSKSQVTRFRVLCVFLSAIVTFFVTFIVLIYRIMGREMGISVLQEITLYLMYYYLISYSTTAYTALQFYLIILKAFEQCVKNLMNDIEEENNTITSAYAIYRLQNLSRMYLNIYSTFKKFCDYFNPNIIIFLIGVTLLYLFNILTFMFYLLDGTVDYYSLQSVISVSIIACALVLKIEDLIQTVSTLNISAYVAIWIKLFHKIFFIWYAL